MPVRDRLALLRSWAEASPDGRGRVSSTTRGLNADERVMANWLARPFKVARWDRLDETLCSELLELAALAA